MPKIPYNLKLHEIVKINDYPTTKILRVPGGWIYYVMTDSNTSVTATFVPYSDEFEEKPPLKTVLPNEVI